MRKSITIKERVYYPKVFTIVFRVENTHYTKQIAAYTLSDAINRAELGDNRFSMKTYFSHCQLSFEGFKSLIKDVY